MTDDWGRAGLEGTKLELLESAKAWFMAVSVMKVNPATPANLPMRGLHFCQVVLLNIDIEKSIFVLTYACCMC